MRKLMCAGLSRMMKNKVLGLCAAAMLLLGALMPLFVSPDIALERVFFVYPIIVGILSAVFSGLFLGTEYGDGTIRNKLVAGHSRSAIYLSNLCLCALAGVGLQLCFTLGVCAVGIPRLGLPEMSFGSMAALYLISLCTTVAFAAIYTLLGMLISGRSGSVVTAILLAMLLAVLAVMFNSRLHEPEYYDTYDFNVSAGITVPEQRELNPNYLSGVKREAWQLIYDLQPMGQALQVTTQEMTHPNRLPLYALGLILVTTGAGLFFFRRKDIK